MGVFCEYKDILGKPREGVHAKRLKIGAKSFAFNDIAATIIVAIVIALVWHVNIFKVAGGLFLSGVFLHWLFCVDTEFNRMIELT